jgi:hypothetical protein
MLRVLRDIPVMFQRLLLTNGSSTRHDCDMRQTIPPPGNGTGAGTHEPVRIEVGLPCESTRIQTLLASTEFTKLLKSLEGFLAKAGKSLDPLGREALRDRIKLICLAYEGFQLSSDVASRSNLHEARELLDRLLKILMKEANLPGALAALGYLGPCVPTQEEAERAYARVREICGDETDEMMSRLGYPGPSIYNKGTSERAVHQFEIMLDGLHKLARALPATPKRRRGARRKIKDLLFLAHTLADIWEWWTGERFAYYEESGVPAKGGTAFVRNVVSFIAPERLGQFRTVMENVIEERSGKLHPAWYKKPSDYNNSI